MTLMHSKVYTCVSEVVLTEFMPTSTPKFKFYQGNGVQSVLFEELAFKLKMLKEQVINNGYCVSQHEFNLRSSDFTESWSIGDNIKYNVEMGLLTSKVCCLIDYLLQYRGLTDMRCIIFVQKVITAIVLRDLLNTLLPKYNSWKTKFIAGKKFGLQNQSRKKQNEIVEEFQMGLCLIKEKKINVHINIIVATSILEEGLDVKSCNLAIRFDPCHTMCSFIQSRGCARMQNSDYILMVKSGDSDTCSRLTKYLASGDIMRMESLCHSSLPCDPLEGDQFDEETYCVASTEAFANLSSSISLIQLYCSRLPTDGYFKPTPRWDKETRTLYVPKSCPLQHIRVEGDKKLLKNIACLEACKQLHKIGALSDNLVPDIVIEEAKVEEFGNEPYDENQPTFASFGLVNYVSNNSQTVYHCYLIEFNQHFSYDVSVQDIFLLIRIELDPKIGCMQFDMGFDRGSFLSPNQVLLCKKFHVTILIILIDHNMNKLTTGLDKCYLEDDLEIDYLLLPALVCSCKLQNALVCTSHPIGKISFYIITGIMELDGNSPMELRGGGTTTYKKYYQQHHGIQLQFEHQQLIKARHSFQVKNYRHGHKQGKEEVSKDFVELPPELCSNVMMPISDTFNLKKMHLDHCAQNEIATIKVLEAITTKRCEEAFHYESLETLGDSFLKYAVSQQLFKTYHNHHEGLPKMCSNE
ncbi:Endoribonuclease Dicer 2 [Glycine soja]